MTVSLIIGMFAHSLEALAVTVKLNCTGRIKSVPATWGQVRKKQNTVLTSIHLQRWHAHCRQPNPHCITCTQIMQRPMHQLQYVYMYAIVQQGPLHQYVSHVHNTCGKDPCTNTHHMYTIQAAWALAPIYASHVHKSCSKGPCTNMFHMYNTCHMYTKHAARALAPTCITCTIHVTCTQNMQQEPLRQYISQLLGQCETGQGPACQLKLLPYIAILSIRTFSSPSIGYE